MLKPRKIALVMQLATNLRISFSWALLIFFFLILALRRFKRYQDTVVEEKYTKGY